MINIDDKTRRLSQATIVVGYKQENKAESIEFKIPEYLKEYGKKICFKTKDGKVFSKLFDNTTSNIFTFTRTETQYGELNATIEFFKTENEDMIIYKTSMLQIIFNESIICEDEVQPDEPKIPILESLIEKVTDLNNTITENEETRNNNENTRISNEDSRIANETQRDIYYTGIQNKVNNGEFNGATYLPNVDADGNISWTNNKGLENPSSQNIRGPQGIQGPQGEAFKIKKTYSSIEVMQADFDNMEVGDYVMIVTSIELEDNAKLYSRTETEWVFITDFSGAQGIQGEQGPQGIQGIQGEKGTGISSLEVRDGSLYVTLTDNTTQNAGLIITDEVKQWLVNEVTNNAQSNFNTYYNGKVTDFNNYTTTKIQEYDTNAQNKITEYDEHTEELTNRITTLENEKTELQLECKRLREDNQAIAIIGQASGENITLNDSSDARFKKFEIGGNSWQETREGYNKIDLRNVNNLTENGITYTIDSEKGSVAINGEATATANLKILLNKDIPAGTAISFGINNAQTDANITARLMDVTGTTLKSIGLNSTNNKVENITLTGDINSIYVRVPAGAIVNNIIIYPQLETSTQLHDFEIYGLMPSTEFISEIKNCKDSINIKVCNKNLLNVGLLDFEEKTINGVTVKNNHDGTYSVNGTSTGSVDLIIKGDLSTTDIFLKIKKGLLCYSTNLKNTDGYIAFHDHFSNRTLVINANASYNNQVVENITYMFIRLAKTSGITFNEDKVIFQLEYNSSTELIPHEEQAITFPLAEGQVLHKDDYLADDGIHHKRKTIILNGTETCTMSTQVVNNTTYAKFDIAISSKVDTLDRTALCSHLKYKYQGWTTEGNINTFSFTNNSNLRLLLDANEFDSVEKLTTYLTNNNMTFEYVLLEEEIESYTEKQQTVHDEIKKTAHSYGEQTHIFSLDEISLIFNIEHLKDTQAYIDNQITTLCNSRSSSDTIET